MYEVPGGRSRIVPMEGVRGLAVLLVFFVHFHSLFGSYAGSSSVAWIVSSFLGTIGHAGVDLFFVLSGYLIYGALLRKPVSYGAFVKRRLQRIYPTFLCVLMLYLLLSAMFPDLSKVHGPILSAAVYILQNVLLLPGVFPIIPIITVSWSLSFEFFFYLTIPALVCVARMRMWSSRWRVMLFSGLWCSYVLIAFLTPVSRVRLLMFFPGVLIYEAFDSRWAKRWLAPRWEYLAAALFPASLLFGYLLDAAPGRMSFLPALGKGQTVLPGVSTYQGPYKVILFSLAFSVFVLYSLHGNGVLSRLFSWTPLRYLGNMSYSYYLFHGLTLSAVARLLQHFEPQVTGGGLLFGALCLAAFTATWVSSTMLFVLVERPFSLNLPLGRQLASPARQIGANGGAAQDGGAMGEPVRVLVAPTGYGESSSVGENVDRT